MTNVSFKDVSVEFIAAVLVDLLLGTRESLKAAGMRMIEPTELYVEPETVLQVVSTRIGDDVVCFEQPVEVPELRCGERRALKNEREIWVPCPVCEGQGYQEDEGRKYRCKECSGKKGWWDDHSEVNANFTTSGDNPVTVDQPTKLAMTTPRNMFEQAPWKGFYSIAKFNPQFSGMHATNEEGLVLKTLLAADKMEDPRRREIFLRAAWKRFWEKHFAYAECAQWWLTPRAVKRIKEEFRKRGIVSAAARIAAVDAKKNAVREHVLRERVL